MDSQIKRYQISCFFTPLLDKQQLEDAISKLKKWITDNNGVAEEEKTRKQNLAYKIKHFQDAFYVLFNFTLNPDKVEKLADKLKLDNDILRHLIVSNPEKSESAKSAKKNIKKLKKEKANLLKELIVEKPEEIKKITDEQSQPEPEAKNDNIPLGQEKVNLDDLDKKLDEILSE